MNAFLRGWSIIVSSWNILKDRPSLMVLPFAGFLLCIPAILLFFKIELSAVRYFEGPVSIHDLHLNPFVWAGLAFPYYFVCDCVVIFFNAALVDACLAGLQGDEISLSGALGAATARLPQILGWSFVCAAVSVLVLLLRPRRGDGIDLMGWLVGIGWRIACYLVLPVLVAQGLGPVGAIKESVRLIKKSWGEGLTGNVGLGLISGVLILAAAALYTYILKFAGPAIPGLNFKLLAVFLLAAIPVAVFLTTLGMIFRCGLYLYATTGQPPAGLGDAAVKQAFGV